MVKCPSCGKEDAREHPIYKILPGLQCQARRESQTRPQAQPEFTTETIREERKTYAKSIVQPWRGSTLSKEYLDANGTKGINPTSEQVKNARNVWTEDISPNMDIKKTK